ncbi:hypothetical protein AVEN_52991-1, partial [Araneus ventricosus]
ILKRGGNAADAAVATMAAVSVIQPAMCGAGGDCHCIFYRKKDKKVMTVNGSGRTGKNATLDKLLGAGITDPMAKECFNHGLWVSVPGTIAGMIKVVEEFGSGKLTMKDIFGPAIRLAEEGVPIPFKHAITWDLNQDKFWHSKNARDLLIAGKAPAPGDIIYAPKLAKVFRMCHNTRQTTPDCRKSPRQPWLNTLEPAALADASSPSTASAPRLTTPPDTSTSPIPHTSCCPSHQAFKVSTRKGSRVDFGILSVLTFRNMVHRPGRNYNYLVL